MPAWKIMAGASRAQMYQRRWPDRRYRRRPRLRPRDSSHPCGNEYIHAHSDGYCYSSINAATSSNAASSPNSAASAVALEIRSTTHLSLREHISCVHFLRDKMEDSRLKFFRNRLRNTHRCGEAVI